MFCFNALGITRTPLGIRSFKRQTPSREALPTQHRNSWDNISMCDTSKLGSFRKRLWYPLV